MTLPTNPRHRPPNPEDTNTGAIAARLRDRLRLRRADGGPEALFVPVQLYDRGDGRQAYPGQIRERSTARAEDMNEIQIRALDGLGRLDADVELLVGRARIEIASEISRLRRVHDAFVWETSIEPDAPGLPDPNPDDLWDVLRRVTRRTFHEAVDVLVGSLGRFWDGPPEFGLPLEGGQPRHPTIEAEEARQQDQVTRTFRLLSDFLQEDGNRLYRERLLYLRTWLPHCRWPMITPSDNPFLVEGSAAEIYFQTTGRRDASTINSGPPPPGSPFYGWLHGGEGDAALRASFPVSGNLSVPLRLTATNRPGKDKENYLDP